jgi:hypothetical protein
VPAHTIAYDSEANQTIVYVNPTDHPVSIGDSGLLTVHLPVATVQLSDFVLAPTRPATTATTVVAASDALHLATTTQNDVTIVATAAAIDLSDATIMTASNADISSDATVLNSAHLVDGSQAAQTINIDDGFHATRDFIDSIEHAKFASFDEGGMPSTEDSVDDAVVTPPSGPSFEPPLVAGTALMQSSFTFDHEPVFDTVHEIDTSPTAVSDSGVLTTLESASGNRSIASAAGEPATPMQGADVNDVEPSFIAQFVSGGIVDTPGDSFHFKDEISAFRGSGVIVAELNNIQASVDRYEDAGGTHGALAISEGGETPGTLGDSFRFKDEIANSKGSGVTDVAGLDKIPASTSYYEGATGARVPPAVSDGAQAIELLSLEQHPDDHFNIVQHHAPGAPVTHAPYDLIV